MNSYIVFLGRETAICLAEITAILKAQGYKTPVPIGSFACLLENYSGDISTLQDKLGGVVKIASVEETLAFANAQSNLLPSIQSVVDNVLQKIPASNRGKITFSLSLIHATKQRGVDFNTKLTSEALKGYLSQRNRVSRFVLGGQLGLSSVQMKTQKVREKGFEILVVASHEWVYICKTVTVQDYKAWQKRDFGRPESDPKRGMLPPKLARIMINIANSLYRQASKRPKTLYDPFCGEGTVLQEALLLGFTVFGSDIDKRAIDHTQKNLGWLLATAKSDQLGKIDRLVTASVNTIACRFPKESIDLIVTEPYLGPPVRGQLNQKLIQTTRTQYTKHFYNLLTNAKVVQPAGGILAVIVPYAHTGPFSQLLIEKNVLDSREKFGYTLLRGPFSYARPDAKIGRLIYFFQKGK